MRYISPSKFLQLMFSNINNWKMNNSPIRNKYEIWNPSAECILVNIESTWLYLQSNISLLHVGVKQVPGEISTIIQA